MNNLDINSVFILFIIVVNSALATLVYRQNKNNIVNKLFISLNVLVSLWAIILYLETVLIDSLSVAKFLVSLDFMLAAILTGIFLEFCLHFPQAKKTNKYFWLILIPSIIFAVLSFTNYIVANIQFSKGELDLHAGFLYLPYAIYIGIYVIIGLGLLVSKLRTLKGEEKLQTIYVLIGLALSAIFLIIFTLILPRIIDPKIAMFGAYGLVFFSIFTTHAILKSHLLDVKVIGAEILVGLLVFIFALDMFFSRSWQNLAVKFFILLFIIYGGYELIQSVLDEIKKRKQLQELTNELKIANKRLSELDALKTEFVSVASHELLTPISAIQGYLHMIVVEKILSLNDPRTGEILKKVHDSSNRLARLVMDLLNVSRIESGRLILEKQALDINQVIQTTISELKIKASEKNLTIKWSPEIQPKVYTDRDKLKQVLTNVLGNAIKYTEKGWIEIRTEVAKNQELGTKLEGTGERAKRTSEVGDFIIVHVQDSGIGIPKEELGGIFKKFHRIGDWKTRTTSGTGLGLYISQNIIEMLGGKIWVESEYGKGSTFSFSVPVAKSDTIKKDHKSVPNT